MLPCALHDQQITKQKDVYGIERAEEARRVQQLTHEIRKKEKEAEDQRTALQMRDAQLGESDRKIKELERSRRVLQQQLTDLKFSVQPKDQEIQFLREQIRELDEEYNRSAVAAGKREEVIAGKSRRAKSLQTQLGQSRNKLSRTEAIVSKFTHMLELLVSQVRRGPRSCDRCSVGLHWKSPTCRCDCVLLVRRNPWRSGRTACSSCTICSCLNRAMRCRPMPLGCVANHRQQR